MSNRNASTEGQPRAAEKTSTQPVHTGARSQLVRVRALLLTVAAAGGVVMWAGAAQAADAVQGNAERARGKISMCTGCHGIAEYRASFPEVYNVPFIAGQSPKYLSNALEAYRKGDRDHPTMRAIAGSLSDEDIADLAAFYGSNRDGSSGAAAPAQAAPAQNAPAK